MGKKSLIEFSCDAACCPRRDTIEYGDDASPEGWKKFYFDGAGLWACPVHAAILTKVFGGEEDAATGVEG